MEQRNPKVNRLSGKYKGVSCILYCLIITILLLLVVLIKHSLLKIQIRRLSTQVQALLSNTSEKMLDIALIDHDLELLAGRLNRCFAGQRYVVASALKHEARLKESIADISHDLRTPLTVIMGHLQLLRSSSLSDSQLLRVEAALRKAERMNELIGAFYDIAVLDAGGMKPEWEQFNYSNFLLDFLAGSAPLFEKRQLQPRIHLPELSLYIRADRLMLERILQNLISNAVRYSGGDLDIILTWQPKGYAVLQVENTVANNSEIDPERLFDRFYTGDKSRSNQSTGLGLAVARMLAEELGGEIHALLKGNTLSVRLSFPVTADSISQ